MAAAHVATSSPAANAQDATKPLGAAPAYLEKSLRAGLSYEQYLTQTVGPLRISDKDGNGLDAQDIESILSAHLVQQRANRVLSFLIHDLDGDGEVTRREMEASFERKRRKPLTDAQRAKMRPQTQKLIDGMFRADTNVDGTISYAEMRQVIPARGPSRKSRQIENLKSLLELDPNNDGRLTAKELSTLATETYRRYDKNDDDMLSETEVEVLLRQRRAVAHLSRQLCELPRPTAEEQVVVLGVYEGKGLSTVSVVGGHDRTLTSKLVIEPGPRPLYVVLSSYEGMIWQFEGETKRVARAFVVPSNQRGKAGAGVVGLPANQVTFLKPKSCGGDYHSPTSQKAKNARALIEHKIGRPIDALFGTYGLSVMKLPSGALAKTPRPSAKSPPGIPQKLWKSFLIFAPSGISDIDPASVVAPKPVEPYAVLPGQAGLIQLLQQGSVKVLSGGEYHIVKPIPHFPPGLHGAHSVKFLLGKGVPKPAGSPGHSCVMSEATGGPVAPFRQCRR